MTIDYYEKYLKYKAKYLELQKQMAGAPPENKPFLITCLENKLDKTAKCNTLFNKYDSLQLEEIQQLDSDEIIYELYGFIKKGEKEILASSYDTKKAKYKITQVVRNNISKQISIIIEKNNLIITIIFISDDKYITKKYKSIKQDQKRKIKNICNNDILIFSPSVRDRPLPPIPSQNVYGTPSGKVEPEYDIGDSGENLYANSEEFGAKGRRVSYDIANNPENDYESVADLKVSGRRVSYDTADDEGPYAIVNIPQQSVGSRSGEGSIPGQRANIGTDEPKSHTTAPQVVYESKEEAIYGANPVLQRQQRLQNSPYATVSKAGKVQAEAPPAATPS